MTFAFSHAILVGIATIILMLPAPALTEPVLWDSSYLLFTHDGQKFQPICTTFPIDQDGDVTYFATASHCLDYKVFAIAPSQGYRLIPATVEVDSRAFDVAVLSIIVNPRLVKVLPLGEDPAPGDAVQSVIFPRGQFRRLVAGTVASPVDRSSPHLTFDIHLSAPVLGASGSAIFCVDQQAVCGIMSGYQVILPSLSVAVPVSHLKELQWRIETPALGDTDSTQP